MKLAMITLVLIVLTGCTSPRFFPAGHMTPTAEGGQVQTVLLWEF